MSTHMPGFQSFLRHFVLAKLANGSIRVRHYWLIVNPWQAMHLSYLFEQLLLAMESEDGT